MSKRVDDTLIKKEKEGTEGDTSANVKTSESGSGKGAAPSAAPAQISTDPIRIPQEVSSSSVVNPPSASISSSHPLDFPKLPRALEEKIRPFQNVACETPEKGKNVPKVPVLDTSGQTSGSYVETPITSGAVETKDKAEGAAAGAESLSKEDIQPGLGDVVQLGKDPISSNVLVSDKSSALGRNTKRYDFKGTIKKLFRAGTKRSLPIYFSEAYHSSPFMNPQTKDDKSYRISLVVSHYELDEDSLKIMDGKIDLEVNQKFKNSHGYERRKLQQSFPIPDYVDKEKFKATVKKDGELIIEAPYFT